MRNCEFGIWIGYRANQRQRLPATAGNNQPSESVPRVGARGLSGRGSAVISNAMTTDEKHELLLRPVIARLREVEKKCASMGSRNEEFPLMQQRLASIIRRLESGREPSGAPLAYRAIAREIFPIAHVFESVGFMSVGREIAHIEKVLNELEPVATVPTDETAAQTPVTITSSSAQISSAASQQNAEPNAEEREEEEEGPSSGPNVPWPVMIAFLVLLVAAGISGSLILRIGPFRELPPTPVPPPTAMAVSATPTPFSTSPPPAASRSVPPTAGLADELSQARLAIAREDLEGAVIHLSGAAMIDRDNTTVLEIAEQLVQRLVAKADAAAESGHWGEAEKHLERARRIAMRFGIETAPVDNAARRLAAMVRFVVIGPDDTAAIIAAVERRVVVTLIDRNRRSGRIKGLADAVLLLEVESDVGGGVVRYTDEIPLDTITSIKIFED